MTVTKPIYTLPARRSNPPAPHERLAQVDGSDNGVDRALNREGSSEAGISLQAQVYSHPLANQARSSNIMSPSGGSIFSRKPGCLWTGACNHAKPAQNLRERDGRVVLSWRGAQESYG